ncbi:MAG: hypothetical protein ACRDUV_13380 [Pseudonocardiaceae bacterium]
MIYGGARPVTSIGDPDARYLRGGRRRQVARELAERFRGDPVPIQDLAAEVNRSPSLVRRLLEEAGVRAEDESCLGMSTGEIAAALATRYQSGVPIDRMYRDTGIDRRRIRQLLADQSTPLRTQQPLSAEQLPWVIKQYQRGATLRALAELTGSSYSTIRRKLIAAGVTPARPRFRTQETQQRRSCCSQVGPGGLR